VKRIWELVFLTALSYLLLHSYLFQKVRRRYRERNEKGKGNNVKK